MKPHEIFANCSPGLANEMFSYLLERENPVYKKLIRELAIQRKHRPVSVERKPKAERHVWLQNALSEKASYSEAAQTLEIWLLGAKRDMLLSFLDSLGVTHDDLGVVEDLPAEPSRDVLEKAVNDLLEKHEPEAVAVYLRLFQFTNDRGWPTLAAMLEADNRLALKPAPAPTAPTAPPPAADPVQRCREIRHAVERGRLDDQEAARLTETYVEIARVHAIGAEETERCSGRPANLEELKALAQFFADPHQTGTLAPLGVSR